MTARLTPTSSHEATREDPGVPVTSQPSDPLHREGRTRERQHREAEQDERVVVAGGAVEVNLVASRAPMDDDPLAVAAHGDADGLHQRAALSIAVTGGVVVEMAAPETGRAVVPVGGAGRVE